jgi:hypothetical protein
LGKFENAAPRQNEFLRQSETAAQRRSVKRVPCKAAQRQHWRVTLLLKALLTRAFNAKRLVEYGFPSLQTVLFQIRRSRFARPLLHVVKKSRKPREDEIKPKLLQRRKIQIKSGR